MKYCPYCGAGLHEKMSFCPKCGQKYAEAENGAAQFLNDTVVDEKPHSDDTVSKNDDTDSRLIDQGNEQDNNPKTNRKNKRVSAIIGALLVLLLAVALVLFGDLGGTGVPKQVMGSRDSVVRIVSDYGDEYGLGSGFVVSRNSDYSLIITNAHVIEGYPKVITVFHNLEEVSAKVFARDNNKDLCILQTEKPVSAKPISIAARDAKQGAVIYAAGFPAAADTFSDTFDSNIDSITLTNGIVSAVRSATISYNGSPVTLLQINAAINPGNSGGPLLDKRGRVVGVNTYSAYDSQGIFAAIASSEVLSFLRENNVKFNQAGDVLLHFLCAFAVALIAFVIAMLVRQSKNKKTKPEFSDEEIILREAKKEKKRSKRRHSRKRLFLVIICLILLAVGIAGVVYAPYFYMGKGEFSKAERFVLVPSLFERYDPYLVEYVTAGKAFENEEYENAQNIFEALPSDYYNTRELYYEASYALAMQELDDKKYVDALSIMNSLINKGYKEANEVLPEIQEKAYVEMRKLYRGGYYTDSSRILSEIGSYKDCNKYRLLLAAKHSDFLQSHSINEILDIFDFEDASSILVNNADIARAFLKGNWTSSDGTKYFYLDQNGAVSYSLWEEKSIPPANLLIKNGNLYMREWGANNDANGRHTGAISSLYTDVKLLTIIPLTKDSIKVKSSDGNNIFVLFKE